MHHQYRNDTSEKNEQHNSQADKDSSAQRVVLLFMSPEWRQTRWEAEVVPQYLLRIEP